LDINNKNLILKNKSFIHNQGISNNFVHNNTIPLGAPVQNAIHATKVPHKVFFNFFYFFEALIYCFKITSFYFAMKFILNLTKI
jgi:hypothetical protein